jgi:hypothetical protein
MFCGMSKPLRNTEVSVTISRMAQTTMKKFQKRENREFGRIKRLWFKSFRDYRSKPM